MDKRLKIALWVIGLVGFIAAIIGTLYTSRLADLLQNLGTEMVGIVVTVAIIDRIYKRGEEKELMEKLIRQMRSRNNADATEAVRELAAHGWLKDGTLHGRNFFEANLNKVLLFGASLEGCHLSQVNFKEAILSQANLRGAGLQQADLREADLVDADLELTHMFDANVKGAKFQKANLRDSGLDDEQLASAYSLMGATMPTGERYDGRYRLPADMEAFNNRYGQESDESWAGFYGVTVEEYQVGRKWADENLHKYQEDDAPP